MKIYADNAATTKMCPAAIEAMLPFLDRIYGNPSSLHSVGQEAAEALADARQRIAACIGADPGEIVFTSGGSEADNQAILSAARLGRQQGRQHIISTAFEHHAVLHTLEKLKREGFEVTLLDVHENGIVLPHQVEEAIRENTCLVTVMYANNEIGTIQPIREIGAICRAKGVPFHTDAVQAAGHLPIHVGEQNLDLLSLSAHKFHGPKGVGVLYARKGIPLFPLIEGGAQERGRRAGTENLPAIMGMTAALELACSQIDENARHLTALRDQLIQGLAKIPHSVLNGDPVQRLPRASKENLSFFCWTTRGSAPPPAQPARPDLWTPAMCCWPSAGSTTSPTAPCGSPCLRRQRSRRSRRSSGPSQRRWHTCGRCPLSGGT